MQNVRIPTIILYFIKQCQVFAQGTNFSPSLLQKTQMKMYLFLSTLCKHSKKRMTVDTNLWAMLFYLIHITWGQLCSSWLGNNMHIWLSPA